MTQKKKRPLPVYLNDAERNRLTGTVASQGSLRDLTLIHTMLQYGLRASEVLMLQVEDVNLDARRVAVTRLKNGIDNELPLIRPLLPIMRRYLEQLPPHQDILFTGQRGALTRNSLWRMMQRYGKAAKLPRRKRHPHVLRHTAAVHALDAGLDIMDVKDLLGHVNVANTTIYAQVSDKKRRAAFRVLEAANGH
ncbi:hypothetical protein LCGC14_0859810 [marine sediment metagenome]|uniref:Tyr recombinase domain-containing protein n=1 Tax=marine sediment metagenome TaxID=412755 RepID=A0A0F9RSE4_9ZZZZ